MGAGERKSGCPMPADTLRIFWYFARPGTGDSPRGTGRCFAKDIRDKG